MVLLLLPVMMYGQRNVMENDLKFSRKRYHFGIHLAGGLGDFKIRHNALFGSSDSILSIKSKSGYNFEIAALMSYHINKYLEIRTVPGFSFANKKISYDFADKVSFNDSSKSIDQIYFDFPIELKIKSEPLKDIKLYLLVGLKYGYDIGGNFSNRKREDMPKVSLHDFGVNYGAGIEIHFPLFILSPEFRVFNSVLNLHKPNETLPYSRFLKGLYNRTFTFSINFEG